MQSRSNHVGHALSLLIVAAIPLVPPLSAQRFVGAGRCAGCHPEIASRHRLTAHAQALHRASEHPLSKDFIAAPAVGRAPGVQFTFSGDSDSVGVTAVSKDDKIEMEFDWAFGAGSQGVTFISRGNEAWHLEHAMSYFPAAGVFDRTPGHDRQAKTLTEAVGILYPLHDAQHGIVACFECHSTGPVLATAAGIEVREQGVQCESCHGPGGDHVTAVTIGETAAERAAIVNPSRLDSKSLSVMCGQCHRPPGAADSSGFDATDPWNVRHAPPYLQSSACFKKSSGALSCLNCHASHEPLRRDEAEYYARICSACHPSVKHSGAVETEDCTSCHMPKAQPHRRLAFTNHRIGIYKDPLPSQR